MIIKSLIITHRYVGVVLGVLMTVWCLSGFVMMYQPYRATSAGERQAGLEPLDLSACCASLPITDDTPLGIARIEMLGGQPVLRGARDLGRRREDGDPHASAPTRLASRCSSTGMSRRTRADTAGSMRAVAHPVPSLHFATTCPHGSQTSEWP